MARGICLAQLTQRARTRAELAAALQRRGVPAAAACAVLDRFTEVGLIDDGALAASLALAQHRERGLARRAVAVKLRRRGIGESAVQAALDQIDAASEVATARLLVSRRLTALGGMEPQSRARRLVGLLARRGYPPDLAYQIVREVLGDPDIAHPPEIDN
ncbi:MAG: regulatory protein RecX [Jatrophihabitantaceae bacterium]